MQNNEIIVRLMPEQVQKLNEYISEAPELFDNFFDVIEVGEFRLVDIQFMDGNYYYKMRWNS